MRGAADSKNFSSSYHEELAQNQHQHQHQHQPKQDFEDVRWRNRINVSTR